MLKKIFSLFPNSLNQYLENLSLEQGLIVKLKKDVCQLGINNIRIIKRIRNDLVSFKKRLDIENIQLGSELWNDLVFLVVVTGFIKYFHPEKITEVEKVDAEAWAKEQKNSSQRYRKKLKSEAKILTELVVKKVEEINPNFHKTSLEAVNIIVTFVSDGVLPSNATPILEKLEKIERIRQNEAQVKIVEKSVKTLLDLLQLDMNISDKTSANIDQQISNFKRNINNVSYKNIIEILSILEKFGLKKKAKELSEAWKEALEKIDQRKLIGISVFPDPLRSKKLKKAKIDDSAVAIILEACLKLSKNEEGGEKTAEDVLKERAKIWLLDAQLPTLSDLEELGKQPLSFWREVFKETKTLGYIVNFLDYERVVVTAQGNVLAPIQKTIRDYLKELSDNDKSGIYKTRYAKYLLTSNQKILKRVTNDLRSSVGYPFSTQEEERCSADWTAKDADAVFDLFVLSDLFLVSNNYQQSVLNELENLRRTNREGYSSPLQNFGAVLYSYLKELSSDEALTDYQREKIKEVLNEDKYPWKELSQVAKDEYSIEFDA